MNLERENRGHGYLSGDPLPDWMRERLQPYRDDRPLPPPPEPERKGRRRGLALLLVLALAAGTVLVDRALLRDPSAPPTSSGAVTGPAPIQGNPDEPVAAVADVLSRSVVQIETIRGLGSGVVYDEQGLILTAAHVVGSAEQVTVRLPDGERLTGRVVGADAQSDVAVVEVNRSGLPPATLALGRPVRVGQVAVAIGSPFGLEGSVTAGVVSAVDRSITTQAGASASMIQTDASINPGNSGGALADAKGRVIGINDAIRSDTGVNAGVGFAIPIDVAMTVADALLQGREPQFGFLGIAGTDPTSGPAGALVTEVTPGSAAEDAGIQDGDVITTYDGNDIEGMSELASLIRATTPGETVELTVLRDGRRVTLEARIGTR